MRYLDGARYHPLTWFLAGGIPAVILVHSLLSLPFFLFFLAGCLLALIGGLYATPRAGTLGRVGLLLAGAGVMGIYTLAHVVPLFMARGGLVNRRVHVEGQYRGDGNFRVRSVNGKQRDYRLYLPFYELEDDTIDASESWQLSLTATVRWPFESRGFGDWLRGQGYVGLLEVHRIHDRQRAPPSKPSVLRRHLRSFFSWSADRWPRSTAFLEALVLGDKQALDGHDRTVFKRLGLVHLFVISGFHVGLLFVVVRCFFRPLGETVLWLGGTALILCYLWFLGWPPSATRAGVMIVLLLSARRLNRRTTPWSYLWTAVLMMFLIDPSAVVDVGFQMTVAAVVGIFLVMDYVRALETVPLADYAIVSLGAFVGIMPVLLYHFHYVPALGTVFATAGVLVFPFFVTLLALQWGLMAVEWTTLANVIEWGFVGVMDVLAAVALHSNVLTVTGITLGSVILLAMVMMVLLDVRGRLWVRLSALVVILGLLGGVLASGPRSHTEIRLVGDRPVIIHVDGNGRRVLLLPEYVRLAPHHVAELGRHLRSKGIRHVDLMISDYTRSVWRQQGAEFTVGDFRVHWRMEGSVRKGGLEYNATTRRLILPGTALRLEPPESFRSRPEAWLGYVPERYCLLSDINRLTRPQYEQLVERKCRSVILTEEPFLVDPSGRRVEPKEVLVSVERAMGNGVEFAGRFVTRFFD